MLGNIPCRVGSLHPRVGKTVLIQEFEVEVFTPPCEPGAERHAARARLTADISEVLPYLNATLQEAVYWPQANALTWKIAGHSIAFNAFEIATSNVEDRLAAEDELKGLVELVNQTWERRSQLEPDYTTRLRPIPMAIFRLLPKTNCKQCGEPTCFSFALKLCVVQRSLSDCPPITAPENAANLAALQEMVIDGPSIGRRGIG